MGRLWKNVHRSCSPFLQRPSIRRLYQRPGPLLRKILKSPFTCIALGCADGAKESLLFKKMPPPACLWTADINLPLARRAASRLPAQKRSAYRVDLTTRLPSWFTRLPGPRLITLFGVIPNLDPLPLLRRISRIMLPNDYLLLSANLAPGRSGLAGTRRILPQYDNEPTRVWLEEAVRRYRPSLPTGKLVFGVFPDPRQKSLARVDAPLHSRSNPGSASPTWRGLPDSSIPEVKKACGSSQPQKPNPSTSSSPHFMPRNRPGILVP